MDQNGLRQTPFAEAACPVPDAQSGDQGIGGGLDMDAGANGLSAANCPWTDKPVPTPSGGTESGPFGNPSRFSTVDGSTQQGASLEDSVATYKNTVDKR